MESIDTIVHSAHTFALMTDAMYSLSEKKTKIRVLFLSIFYPLFMGKYFLHALQRREDIDLISCGPYTYGQIPWKGGMDLGMKYAEAPNIILTGIFDGEVDYNLVKSRLPIGWVPDLIITADAGIHWKSKPTDGLVAHIATDPHVLNYDLPRSYSDKFFNMQKVYMKDGDTYLPYACDVSVFFPKSDVVKDVDAVLIGMPYAERVTWVDELRKRGLNIIFENGPIFEEANNLYNRGRIGLNWSSMDDLNCRTFELMGIGLCPVINRVTDLKEMFVEDEHYLGFSSLQEGIDKVMWAREHPNDVLRISNNAYNAIVDRNHTYDHRVGQILINCGFV